MGMARHPEVRERYEEIVEKTRNIKIPRKELQPV
jgi:hypothetical protein